ncbi:hypothetical protein GQX73_g9917 [Xylaria multiplex]|uniref:J domain-containing protein n=1 Tax=Xylaria multiplex TaxID=323545 RepID=A0A7C8MRC6_9PEZI|nr:hypothetical protein GQX73_g9917 [Xylaria multiplex]
MEDKKSELLQYAREYATANKDLYELLSVSADAAQPDVHRAWRKASLKHHPDKAKNFDPEIWQLFERARDVLSSPEARAAYDSACAAAVQAQKARAALDAKKRAMIDDLEARERGVKRKAGEETNGRRMMTEAEKRVLMEKGREHLEKRRRMKEEAEARERERARMEEDRDVEARPNSARVPTSTDTRTEGSATPQPPPAADEYDERIADIERKLRERKAEKAARKAGKKTSSGNSSRASGGKNNPPGEATTIPPPPTEKPVSPHKPTSTQPPASTPVFGDFSSTMAKLRAAQREKERKKAEAAAVAAATAPTTASDDIS